ncbi:MAG: hypothetical protein LUH51_00445 [Firmicutes bacterium]|nr:hypothetical protein [Bacillota bacterium]
MATNLETGEPEFWERSNCSDVLLGVQASASMPFVSKIVYVEGKPCLDGGCCVHIPYRWAMEEGYEKILVIRTRHRDFRYPDPEKQETLSLQIYRNYPAFAEKLSWSHRRYNAECDELQTLEDAGRVFVIAPSVTWSAAKLERDMEKLGRWYWQGCRDAQAAYPALREYLENAQNEPLGDCVR